MDTRTASREILIGLTHDKVPFFLLLIFMFFSQAALADSSGENKAKFATAYKEYEQRFVQADWQGALNPAIRSYELGKTIYEPGSETVVLLANNLAYVLARLGKKVDAMKYYWISLQGAEELYGEESPELIQILLDMAAATSRPYQRGPEKKYFKRALKISKKYYGRDSREFGELNVRIGSIILHESLTYEGRQYINRGIEILEKTESEDSELYGMAVFQKAKYELASDNYRKAETYFNRALDVFDGIGGDDNSIALTTHAFLVRVNEELGQSDVATRHCLAIARLTPESGNQEMTPVYRAAPVYPREAAELRIEGWVELTIDVNESGFVVDPKVTAYGGHEGFKAPAIESVKRYRFAPAFRNGEAVLTEDVSIRIRFNIAD